MADIGSVAPMLREVWPASFNTAFSNEIVALSRIEESEQGVSNEISGRYTTVPLRVSRNEGIGSRPERGILPSPGRQGYVTGQIELKAQYGVGSVTSHVLNLADTDRRSFIDAITEELEGVQDDVMKDYARMVYTPSTGELAEVVSTGTENGDDYIEVDHIQYFVGADDRAIDAIDVAGPTVTASEMIVTGWNVDDNRVYVDNNDGVSAGNILVREGNYHEETYGLLELIDDETTVENINPNDVPKWKSVVLGRDRADAGNPEPWDETEIVRANDEVRISANENISVMFTGFGVRRAVFNDLKQQREYVNTIEFAHGFEALPFHLGSRTIPLVADPDYPEDRGATSGSILGVDESTVSIFREPSGWHFAEESGSMFIPATNREDSFEFRMRQFSNLGIRQRNCHFKILGLQTDLYEAK